MKKLFSFLILTLIMQHVALAQCGVGSYTVTTNQVIIGSCKITGDLTILNGGTLNVDLSGSPTDTFVVRGNIVLQGNAVLWVHGDSNATGDQFIVSNSYNNQRTITTEDSSRIQLEYIEFRTQEGNLANAGSFSMNYNAEGKSILYVNTCWLNNQTAWLLCNMKNHSTLMGYATNHVPTETYIGDTAEIALHGANTAMGLWLLFESGTDTLNLPSNQTVPYTWKIGRGVGGLKTPWYVEIDTANPGLGIQVFPTSNVTVNGTGAPATGELKVAMNFSNNTDSVKNLYVGLQNKKVADGSNGGVILNNVNLGPIAWQLYALINENLYIKNSVVNEIGIAGPSKVTVDSSVLQLALLGAVGVGGSSMTINNSGIWNQGITAANNSRIVLNNCDVTGSWFSTVDTLSRITVNGGCFFQNPTGCTEANMVDVTTGQPYCNPFIPAGYPKNLTPATVAFTGVNSNCTNAVETLTNTDELVSIYPNPFSVQTMVQTDDLLKDATLTVYNPYGQTVKQIKNISSRTVPLFRDNLSSGLYFIRLQEENKPVKVYKVVVTDN